MKEIKIKSINILSNGCLNYQYKNIIEFKQIIFNKKDNKTFFINQKCQDVFLKKQDKFSEYKKKYSI